jgi:hypothetical protein
MNKGTVEVKFQDGTAIKIKGSADFVAAVTTSILEVGKGKSGEHIQLAQIKESSQAGKLAHSDYVEKDELEAPADHIQEVSLARWTKSYAGHSKRPANAAASVISPCIGQRVEAT